MEPKVKVVFREANGFKCLGSYMSKLDGSLSAVRTPEWTLGKSECAISGIMVWIYVGGLYWERFCMYRRDTTRCGIYIYSATHLICRKHLLQYLANSPFWHDVQFDLVQIEITHITLFIQLLRCLSLTPQ